MKKFTPLALSALFFLAACAGDKYPMQPQFVTTDAIAITALGTPPKPDSKEFKRGLDHVLALQAKLTDAEKAALRAEDRITPAMIVQPALGAEYTEESYPKLYELLRRTASDAWRIADTHQEYWLSPRPWNADARVIPYVKKLDRPGYPSGHTTTNTTWAYVLSDLFPKQRKALFARAYEVGHHRIDAGAHFPHDVEAGRRLAGLIYGKLRKNPDYQSALSDARHELCGCDKPAKSAHVANAETAGWEMR